MFTSLPRVSCHLHRPLTFDNFSDATFPYRRFPWRQGWLHTSLGGADDDIVHGPPARAAMTSYFQFKRRIVDVVVPAGRIYLRTMKMVGTQGILVPKVGLADGIILGLYADLQRD